MPERRGCARHLPIVTGLFLIAVALVLAANWAAVERAVENATAMSEGAAEARALSHPDSVLAYLARHPEQASLVAFDTDRPGEGVYYRAGVPRPLVGVPTLLALAEYARQVGAGALSPDAPVPAERLEEARLTVRRAAPAAGPLPDRLPLEAVVERAVRRYDAAAADVLLERLGREGIERLPRRLGLGGTEPPVPLAGLYLAWGDTAVGPAPARVAAYEAMPRARFRDEAERYARRYRTDRAYREAERERLRLYGFEMGLGEQRAVAAATLPRGTAAGYGALLAAALRDSLFSPAASAVFRRHAERPIPASLRADVEALAQTGSAFPGVVSFAGYARRPDGSGRVVVLLLEGLPTAVFYHLAQTGIDAAFELALFGDDAFFEQTRTALRGAG
ncbi:MAG: serine hydrolase [Rhodothermales bacterium]|nr:serine hydrolase [Rhodothermales bacterium]